MFKWAILWGKIERNPMDRIPTMRQPPGRYIEVFTKADVAILTSLSELRNRALMTVLFDAGLRKAEARHLQARRCLLEQRQLVVVGGKGGKDRVVPVTKRLSGVLTDLFLTDDLEPGHYVWHATRGNQHAKGLTRSRAIGEGTFHRWWEAP
jgi:site-specific recombinase XerD